MPHDRLLPTRSPIHRAGRWLGRVPHGLPTAVTFSGAAVAVVAGTFVGVTTVIPTINRLAAPRGVGAGELEGLVIEGTPSATLAARPTAGHGEAVRAIVAVTGAGGRPTGPRTTAAQPNGRPTPSPAPAPTQAAPSPSPTAGHGGDDGDDHGWAHSPSPSPTARPTHRPDPTPTPRPDPTPTPTPRHD